MEKLITEFPTLIPNEFTPASYSPDCQLDLDAVRGAIHTLFAGEFASEAEERGHRLPMGCEMNLDLWAPRQADALMLPLAWYLIGRTEQAWRCSIGHVFYHGGIGTAAEQEHALTDLFLGLTGSGVGLDDDFSEELEKAAAVIFRWNRDSESKIEGPTFFKPRPFDWEASELRDLARAIWDKIDGPTVHFSEGRGPFCAQTGATAEYWESVTCEVCHNMAGEQIPPAYGGRCEGLD